MGMRQRLGIAAALIGDPDLVVLDEPTNGVDPQGMKDIRGIIREIARQGRTTLEDRVLELVTAGGHS